MMKQHQHTQTSQVSLASMVKGQLATNGIHDPVIIDALTRVDRTYYVPESLKHSAYVDDDIRLCGTRYLLEPLVFAKMLTYATLDASHYVMDVGAGLGYSSAVLSRLSKQVIAIESSAELVAAARKKLANDKINNVSFVTAPLNAGCSAHQPYDRIFLEGAVDAVPQAFEEQLSENGVIIALQAVADSFVTGKILCDIVLGTKRNDQTVYTVKDRVGAYSLYPLHLQEQFKF